jgi:ferredoxin
LSTLSWTDGVAPDKSASVAFRADRCLHSLDKYSSCEVCSDLCPASAIQRGHPPKLIAERCQGCHACLAGCPTEAFVGKSELRSLLSCADRLEGRSVGLLCGRNMDQEAQAPDADVSIRLGTCLAALSAGAYLSLMLMGIEKVFVRTDACQSCSCMKAALQIDEQVSIVERLLSAAGRPCQVKLVDGGQLQPRTHAPVWDVRNPPVSRRDLFRMSGIFGKALEVQALGEATGELDVATPAERRRMGKTFRAVVSHLPHGDVSLAGLPFATVRVSDACTACGACARVCPNGALRYVTDEEQTRFQLTFNPVACSGCQACEHVCLAQAAHVEAAPTVGDVFATAVPVPLRTGRLTRCERCQSPFAGSPGAELCPACEYRRCNPFGSVPAQLLPQQTNRSQVI